MFYDLLKSRRSVRKFLDQEVEKEKLDIILKSALFSPSSRSRRPWEFIVVNDKGLLSKLSRCKEHGSQFLAGAPLGIVVLADPEVCDVWIEDTSIASIIIQLAAQSLGLGSCWIQTRKRLHTQDKNSEDYIKELFNIPKQYSVESVITIGYPAENKEPYDENQLLYDKVHYNQFGEII